ncbi:tetraacyldisaccharide 4'-kinase [Rufibacter immobilis]|uniref:tetraacyldisaccharide 4'-kinase n=1 Tax=Rufibacter immobilis TaxID=1348778 RepID=UPI0035F07B7D
MTTLMPVLRYALFPFSLLYGGIMRLRNWLYDHQVYHVYQAPIPVICVGNLSVGGTGKTPQVEYLARLLQPRKIAILSRGYKRTTKGFVLADALATPASIGDEPYQYTQSLSGVRVAVCEKRAEGIQRLLQLFPDLEVILLDDAFQHRAVKASAYLLLTDFNQLFTQDYVLPAGRLREFRRGARRADAVVVTKCPDQLDQAQQEKISSQIQKYTNPYTPVFFSKIVYAPAVPVGQGKTLGKELVLVTGIANAQPLVLHLRDAGHAVVRHFDWEDHSAVTEERIQEVLAFYNAMHNPIASIVMTQKDAVKWQDSTLAPLWQEYPVFYLPIANAFAPQQPTFDQTVTAWVQGSGNRY